MNEVLRIPENIMGPIPELVSSVDSEYIIGVGKLDEQAVNPHRYRKNNEKLAFLLSTNIENIQ